MSILHDLLEVATSKGASDIHVTPGHEPYLRVKGHLQNSGFEPVSAQDIQQIVEDILPEHLVKQFAREHEADFSLKEDEVGRFRVNVFQTQGEPAIAMRHVKTEIPTFSDLRLPERLTTLADWQRGIVLLSGTTGSGKSTTLAAIIGEINRTQRRRIITIEDPIEYVFEDDQSVITQREIGLDTLDFDNALKHLMRQDPDVILIGEMRDRRSIRTALLAAETGHLVLSTLHAGEAALALPRILDMFPADEQDQIRLGLADTRHAIVCQRLVPDVDGSVVPAVEILINTSTVRKLIIRNKIDVLHAAIETGNEDGMQTFNQSIYQHIKSGLITEEEGMRFASNPEALRMNLQGIFLDESRRILGGE